MLVTSLAFTVVGLFAAYYAKESIYAIDNKLIPALTKHQLNDAEMDFVFLPARLGGMSFDDPVNDSALKHATSTECTGNLTNQIMTNGFDVMGSIRQDSTSKTAIRQRQRASMKDKADSI